MRQARKDMSRAGYTPSQDRKFRDGISKIVRAVDFGPYNFCLQRSLVARAALRRCRIDASLQLGSLLYRVGPDPYRDVIAFCGRGNAGFNDGNLAAFHAWLVVGDDIADFSVGDWAATAYQEYTLPGAPDLGPIQWTIPRPPDYWWRPYAELTKPWRPSGTPELGVFWYGPFNGDLKAMHQDLREIEADLGPAIAAAIDQIFGQQRERFGLPLDDAPAGYQRTTMHEVLRIAGVATDDMVDAEVFVTAMPTTAAEAFDLLRNMTITVPPRHR
jgi:hypothetical protein